MASVDSKVDELYQLPLSEFTTARNALAKTLSGEEAKRIRQLEKPTTVPWAINQLYWKERAVYERLLKSGRALRDAQVATLKGRQEGADLRKATESHRQALTDAAARTARLAKNERVNVDAEALSRTLETLSISATPPSQPGRLTDVLRPAGFEALAGVTPVPRAEPARPPHTDRGKGKAREAEQGSKEAARAERKAAKDAEEAENQREADAKRAEAAVNAAERDLARAKEKASSARKALDEAEDAVHAAEEALREAKKSRDRVAWP